MRRFGAILLVVAAIALPSTGSAQKLYRYIDENGVPQYTDKIPPEDAKRDRDILNDQGVRIESEEGEITEAERLEAEERAKAAQREQQAREDIARHDRMLLQTYLTVADIEDLRNRRLELLESQIKVTELYLGNLRKKLVELQSEASHFKPYTPHEGAPQIPENLALDISRTTASIIVYEQTLARTRSDMAKLKSSFDEDIARFRELKGV